VDVFASEWAFHDSACDEMLLFGDSCVGLPVAGATPRVSEELVLIRPEEVSPIIVSCPILGCDIDVEDSGCAMIVDLKDPVVQSCEVSFDLASVGSLVPDTGSFIPDIYSMPYTTRSKYVKSVERNDRSLRLFQDLASHGPVCQTFRIKVDQPVFRSVFSDFYVKDGSRLMMFSRDVHAVHGFRKVVVTTSSLVDDGVYAAVLCPDPLKGVLKITMSWVCAYDLRVVYFFWNGVFSSVFSDSNFIFNERQVVGGGFDHCGFFKGLSFQLSLGDVSRTDLTKVDRCLSSFFGAPLRVIDAVNSFLLGILLVRGCVEVNPGPCSVFHLSTVSSGGRSVTFVTLSCAGAGCLDVGTLVSLMNSGAVKRDYYVPATVLCVAHFSFHNDAVICINGVDREFSCIGDGYATFRTRLNLNFVIPAGVSFHLDTSLLVAPPAMLRAHVFNSGSNGSSGKGKGTSTRKFNGPNGRGGPKPKKSAVNVVGCNGSSNIACSFGGPVLERVPGSSSPAGGRAVRVDNLPRRPGRKGVF